MPRELIRVRLAIAALTDKLTINDAHCCVGLHLIPSYGSIAFQRVDH